MPTNLGALIINVEGLTVTPEEREMLAHPLVGGVVLFARNYESQKQLKSLCQAIRSASQAPLLIMVDQEGGRVQRFIHEFTRLPPMSLFGDIYDNHPEQACQLARDCGWLMAAELLANDIDLSLAPVLDLNKTVSTVIGNRAFHANPNAVIQLARHFILGMKEAGMAATGKHFPGHGSVNVDSHVAIPIDHRPLEMIENDDLIPFVGLIKAGIHAIMAAHIIFPHVDSHAVGFSRRWLRDILRDKLGFNGVIMSDDLNMEGANISSSYVDRVIASREAGCDFALLCNNHKGAIEVLDRLPYAQHRVSADKWSVLRGQFSALRQPLQSQQRWQQTVEFLQNNAQ